MRKGKLGIALGGGAARGWAHIGVMKALTKAGLEPDIVVGTSIGAVVGGCYVAGKLKELEEFARSLTRRRVLGFLDFNMSGSGLITGRRLCDRLDHHLCDFSIEKLPKKFVAVATELGSGHEIWLSRGKLVDAMRASYALPGIFRPVRLADRWLLDGALVNPVPVSVARALGARTVIAVNLNAEPFNKGGIVTAFSDPWPIQGEDDDDAAVPAQSEPAAAESGGGASAWKLLHRQFFGRNRNEPGISSVMIDAFNIIQDRIARARLMGDPPDMMLTPRLGNISLFEFHRAAELISLGEAVVARELDEIMHLPALRKDVAVPGMAAAAR